MSTFLNDTIGLALVGVAMLLVVLLRRVNHSPAQTYWVRQELPTLLGVTVAVGLFAIGLGVVLDTSL